MARLPLAIRSTTTSSPSPTVDGRHRRSPGTGEQSLASTGRSSSVLIGTTTPYSGREPTAGWPSSVVRAIASISHPWRAGQYRTMPISSGPSVPSLTRATTSPSHRKGSADGDASAVASHPPAPRTRDRGAREDRARIGAVQRPAGA
jgi:hypothetical protein